MLSKVSSLLALAVFFLFFGCAEEMRNCCDDSPTNTQIIETSNFIKVDSLFIENPQMRIIYTASGLYANFGFQFFFKDSACYLVYLNSSKDSLVFINALNAKDYKIKSIWGLIKAKGKYALKLSGDTLHLLDIETYMYKQLKIKKNFDLEMIYESNLSKAFDSKEIFLNSNLVVDKKLVFFNPYLLSFYGNFKTKNNLGTKVWRKINIQTGEESDLFDFPEKYRKCYQRDFYSLIEKISDSLVVAVFRKVNKVYEVNIFTGEIKITSDFSFPSKYMCYDKGQERNLAYTSKYDLLDEENSNLISSDGKIFLIKRLMRKSKQDPIKCAILVFDLKLNQIATYYPDKLVEPRLSFGYKEGVMIINDSLSKAYYYEFKKIK